MMLVSLYSIICLTAIPLTAFICTVFRYLSFRGKRSMGSKSLEYQARTIQFAEMISSLAGIVTSLKSTSICLSLAYSRSLASMADLGGDASPPPA